MNSETHNRLVQYLLGGLSPSERDRIEEEYFVSQEAWEALAAVENDLIDAYVQGHLPGKERQQFEEYFLRSPRKQQRVGFAQNLMDAELRKEVGKPAAAPASSAFRFSPLQARVQRPAAAAVLAIAAILIWQNHQLRIQIGQIRAEQRQASNPRTLPGPTNIAPPTAPISVIAITLSPGLLRGSGSSDALATVRIGLSSAVLVVLNLELDRYPRYDVVLQSAEGRVIERMDGVGSNPSANGLRTLTVAIPSDLLVRGDYILKLFPPGGSHREVIDSYAFSAIQ